MHRAFRLCLTKRGQELFVGPDAGVKWRGSLTSFNGHAGGPISNNSCGSHPQLLLEDHFAKPARLTCGICGHDLIVRYSQEILRAPANLVLLSLNAIGQSRSFIPHHLF